MALSRVRILCICLAVGSFCSCGQKDPVQAPETGRLVILSQPPGASVEVDGRPRAGVTPDTLVVTVGTHTVRVNLDEFEPLPAEREVEVETGGETSADFCLRRVGPAGARLVLVEHFANVDCVPCGPAEVVLHEYQQAHGYGDIVIIGYRTNFPSTQDPLYRANTAVHRGRMNYYSVVVAPTAVFDGTGTETTITEGTLESRRLAALEAPARFAITVSDTLDGSDYRVGAQVTPLDCSTESDLVVHAAVVEREVTLPGEDETLYNVVRQMLPAVAGTAYAPVYGETQAFRWSLTLDPSWDAEEIETVVFVQSVSTRTVFHAGSTFLTTPSR